MAASIPFSPGTAVSTAGNWGINWASPNNALTSNGVRATYTFNGSLSNSATYSGFLTVRNFGIDLPADAVIKGITVQIEAIQTGGSTGTTRLESIYLTKNGSSNIGTNKGNTTVLTATEATQTLGGAADLWGTTWTAADLNNPNFGVRIRPLGSTSGTNRVVGIDYVSVTVEYEANTVIPVDPSGYVMGGGDVFVANGQFEFIDAPVLALAMYGATNVNIPETVKIPAFGFTLTGRDALTRTLYPRTTGLRYFDFNNTNGATIPFSDFGLPRVPGIIKGIQIVFGASQSSGGSAGAGTSGGTLNIPGNYATTLNFTGGANVYNTFSIGSSSDNLGITSLEALAAAPHVSISSNYSPFGTSVMSLDYVQVQIWFASEDAYSVGGGTLTESVPTPVTPSNTYLPNGSATTSGTWTNPENIRVADGSNASITLGYSQTSPAFVKLLSDFGTIPANATISGIFAYVVTGQSMSGFAPSWLITVKPSSTGPATTISGQFGSTTGNNASYGGFIPLNWEPGTWTSDAFVGAQVTGPSNFGGSQTINLDQVNFKVIYNVDPSTKIDVLNFTQTGKDAQALGASAVQVDTRAFTMGLMDVASKNNEAIPVTPRAFTMTRRDALIVEKQLVPIRAFTMGEPNILVSERIPVTPRAFTMARLDAKVTEKQLIAPLAFVQSSPDLTVAAASAIQVDVKAFVQTRLDANVNGREGTAIPLLSATMTPRDAMVVEKQFIPVRPFVMGEPNILISERINVPVLEFSSGQGSSSGTTGPMSGSQMSIYSQVVTVNWVNPNNMFVPDGQYGTFTFDLVNDVAQGNGNQYSDAPTIYNWGANVPANATITGIQARVKAYRTGNMGPFQVTLFKPTTSTAPLSGAKQINFNTVDTTHVVGGPNDTWGMSWTPADANNINGNGLRAQFYAGSNAHGTTMYVDSVQLQFYYTIPAANEVKVTETQRPPVLSFAMVSPEHNVSGATMYSMEPRAFVQTSPNIVVNAKERIAVPVRAFVQTSSMFVRVSEAMNVPVRPIVMNELDVNINAKSKIDVATNAFVQGEPDIKANERIPVGVTAYLQTTQVVKANDRVPVGTKTFDQVEFDVKVNDRVGIEVREFVQTARVVKTTEVLNSFGPMQVVQTSYEVTFPNIVTVSSRQFVMNALGAVLPSLVTVTPRQYKQTGPYPTIYNDLIPTLIARIRWTQWVPGPDGTGAMKKEFVETGHFSFGDKMRYTLQAPPVLTAQLVDDDSRGPIQVPVETEI